MNEQRKQLIIAKLTAEIRENAAKIQYIREHQEEWNTDTDEENDCLKRVIRVKRLLSRIRNNEDPIFIKLSE